MGAAPFAALGFVKYNGMTAEKAIYAWIKSEFLMPKKLVFHSTNVYYELMKPSIETPLFRISILPFPSTKRVWRTQELILPVSVQI